ncbi:dynein light chain roadblock-type, partial [Lecanoromycetidae sp. Uapishka_2]
MVQPTPAATLENLSRLASKPGVQSTLILSKSDGSIIRSTGLLASSPMKPPQTLAVGKGNIQSGSSEPAEAVSNGSAHPDSSDITKGNTAEEVARMVFEFVAASRTFTETMDKSDEVKLLRLRTRKNEIVIVPDPKFLLVVIHDTPPA